MKLNECIWKKFNLGDLFQITAGKYYYSNEYSSGNTPYISASNINNGIKERINLKPDFKGNCIVTGKIGCTAFYQSEDFCATSDVNIFIPKNFKMSYELGMFFVTIINFSENYKWNYGRQCRIGNSEKIDIKLPVKMFDKDILYDKNKKFSNLGYVPDFEYMENFIKALHHKVITTKNKSSLKLPDINTWGKFSLNNLFDKIYKSKANVKTEKTVFERKSLETVEFITRTENNNGCDCYILPEDEKLELENTIIIGDTTATTFYQNEKFLTGDHIIICRASWINKYTGLFVKTIIDKERYRYNYGRAFKMDLIKKTEILLPQTEDKKPNWQLIENYMKSLPYGDRI